MNLINKAFLNKDAVLLHQALSRSPPDLLFNGWTPLQMACHMNWLEGAKVCLASLRSLSNEDDSLESLTVKGNGPPPLELAAHHGAGFLMKLYKSGFPFPSDSNSSEKILGKLSEVERHVWSIWHSKEVMSMLPVSEDLPAKSSRPRM